jgi:uncharacterized protein
MGHSRPRTAAKPILAMVVSAALAACSGTTTPAPGNSVPDGARPGLIDRAAEALARHTDTPTPTSTPTPTPTATVTPTPVHPLSVEFMRQQEYPGSDLTIEETLSPGSNYQRYVVSYLSDGLKIFALLTVPDGERPATGWPVIVFNHGYIAPTVYRTTERYVAYVDGFARNGYIVFKSDYRGHGDSEGRATGGYGSPDYTIDVLNAVATMKRYPDADPDRIGMWGHSMGGSITLRAMVTTRDIKAGVIWAGVVVSMPDLMSRWHRQPIDRAGPTPLPGDAPPVTPGAGTPSPRGRWREQLTALYGSPEQNPAFWASISPNSYVADVSGPIQLHHGTGDTTVPYAFSTTLETELKAAGRTVELYTYEGDNHNLSGGFSSAMRRSVAFFDRYVKGVPAPP